jgi:transcriptional regulator with XRE-family HTH domain
MDINYKKMGFKIKMARLEKGLTQEQLSKMVDMSNNYISNIECNHSIPSLETFIKICNTLEVTPDKILLNSIFISHEYLKEEIAVKLKKINPKDMELVSAFIDLLIARK